MKQMVMTTLCYIEQNNRYLMLHRIKKKKDLNQDKSTTTNGYNTGEDKNGHIIDYCFYSPAKAVPLVYKVLNEKHFDGYVSDHRGLYIEVALT